MNIHVYDTHVHTQSGEYLHFDVLVNDQNVPHVERYANAYLSSLGIEKGAVKQGRCQFCHSEIATPEVQAQIIKQGYCILPLRIDTSLPG